MPQQIGTFPKDEQLRIVWGHGGIKKNESDSTNPLVEVLLVPLGNEKSLAEAITREVTLPELDVVRQFTIWKGQSLTDKKYEHDQQIVSASFDFNLEENNPISIDIFSKDPTNEKSFIPFGKFWLKPLISTNQDFKPSYNSGSFMNAKYNVLIASDGTQVLISALETLTSLYTPTRKDIRRMLVTDPIDKIINKFFKEFQIDLNNQCFNVKLRDHIKGEIGEEAIIFLANLALNPHTQLIVDQITTTLEAISTGKNGKEYPQRHPIIFPPHQKRLEFSAYGFWLNSNKTRFMVTQVRSSSSISDNAVALISEEKERKNVASSNSTTQSIKRQLNDENTQWQTHQDPSHTSGKVITRSNVKVDIPEGVLTKIVIKSNGAEAPSSHQTIPINSVTNEPEQVSSGEAYGSDPNAPKQVEVQTSKQPTTTDNQEEKNKVKVKKPPLDQSSLLGSIYTSLKALSSNIDSSLINVTCLNTDGTETALFHLIPFKELVTKESSSHTWITKGNEQDRGLLITKLVFNNKATSYYLIEISRLTTNEGFRGFIIETNTELNAANISDIGKLIFESRGKRSWLESINLFKRYSHFKHVQPKENKWDKKLTEILTNFLE